MATCKEYKETLTDIIDDLTRHSYITKCQAQYLKMTKETLGGNEATTIEDLAEYYQLLIQDDIQSYHWRKEYCMLHPLIYTTWDLMVATNMIHCVYF